MSNYKLLTGPFAGEISEEVQLLDIPFNDLDENLKKRIYQWAADQGIPSWAGDWDLIKQSYENSWKSQETDDPATIKPVSEWLPKVGQFFDELAAIPD